MSQTMRLMRAHGEWADDTLRRLAAHLEHGSVIVHRVHVEDGWLVAEWDRVNDESARSLPGEGSERADRGEPR